MKLLAIKMVAKSFFGRSNKEIMILSLLVTLASSVVKSEGFKENSATSEPETKAEHNSKTTIVHKLTISGMEI
jgi:hypothetical protein